VKREMSSTRDDGLGVRVFEREREKFVSSQWCVWELVRKGNERRESLAVKSEERSVAL